MVEETTAACHSLTEETGELSRLVGEFKVNKASATPGRDGTAQVSAARRTGQVSRPVQSKRGAVRPALKAVAAGGGSAVAQKSDGWEEF